MSAETADAPRETPTSAPKKPEGRTSLTVLNFWIDATLFVAAIFVMWVTVMLQIVFPPATLADGWRLWGMTFDQWRNAQFGAICVLGLFAVEHLVLHWNWVVTVLATRVLKRKRPDEGQQAVLGVGTFIVVLVTVMASLVAANFCVQKP